MMIKMSIQLIKARVYADVACLHWVLWWFRLAVQFLFDSLVVLFLGGVVEVVVGLLDMCNVS
jgi:tellurite resistance protein TehA-like permease